MALLLASPLIVAIAIAVRVAMGRPILFRQERPGFREQPITCLKFRTMMESRDRAGNLLGDRERTTSLGLFLRRTSLDELPQLWSIFRGDLSFVGPRPLRPLVLCAEHVGDARETPGARGTEAAERPAERLREDDPREQEQRGEEEPSGHR